MHLGHCGRECFGENHVEGHDTRGNIGGRLKKPTFMMTKCNSPIRVTMKLSGGSTKGPMGLERPGSLGGRTGLEPKTGVVEKWNCKIHEPIPSRL